MTREKWAEVKKDEIAKLAKQANLTIEQAEDRLYKELTLVLYTNLAEELRKVSCISTCCPASKNRGSMQVNGPCRCLESIEPRSLRWALKKIWMHEIEGPKS